MTTRSQAEAAALSPPDNRPCNWGNLSVNSLAISTALSAEREPITAVYPIEASRAASAEPAGPVPPRIPMRIPTQ